MEMTSIDNVENDGDGWALLRQLFYNLRHSPDGIDRMLVAIIPEYEHATGDPGRLLRLDVLTLPVKNPPALTATEAELFEAALLIVAERKRKYAAAIAQLEANPPTLVPGPASSKVQALAQSIDKEAKP